MLAVPGPEDFVVFVTWLGVSAVSWAGVLAGGSERLVQFVEAERELHLLAVELKKRGDADGTGCGVCFRVGRPGRVLLVGALRSAVRLMARTADTGGTTTEGER
jgi:hypothetical protein